MNLVENRAAAVEMVSEAINALLASGWSRAKLAKRLGTTTRTLDRWRSGEITAKLEYVFEVEALLRKALEETETSPLGGV